MDRRSVLDAATECVCKTRQDQHGAPENTFATIADMWSVYLQRKYGNHTTIALAPEDVAWMMVLFKVSRAVASPLHEDNAVDAAGYSALASELAQVDDYAR